MTNPGRNGGMAHRLAFFKGLQQLNLRLDALETFADILDLLRKEGCKLFGAQSLHIYVTDAEGRVLLEPRRLTLFPVGARNLFGSCLLQERVIRLDDAADPHDLAQVGPDVEPLSPQRLLLAPILGGGERRQLGVLQLSCSLETEPFSALEEEGALALAQTLANACAPALLAVAPARTPFQRLVDLGRLSAAALERAQQAAREGGPSVERQLLDGHGLSSAELGEALSAFYGVPYEPFQKDRVRPMDLLRRVKRDFAQQNGWLPLEEAEHGLVVVALDPARVAGAREVQKVFPYGKLSFRVSTEDEFARTLAHFFDESDDLSVGDLLSDMNEGEEAAAPDELNAAADNELVKLVNRIIVDAFRQGASDIHIEPRPGKEKTLVRFRRDGVLMPYIEVPASYRAALVARLKIMCDLDISERRKPQDGKIKFRKYGPIDLELRVATIPTTGGLEDVVLRLLSQGEPLALDKLGLSEHNQQRLEGTISKPYGLFFVCGPTGSGKTTTLHSILRHINRPETKIWTAEDPVEITQRGLRQVQVNRKAGLDFATVMRAFLRADPDVIMVGEMRDAETVQVGIEASLTGHLVLSTLHTNSAPESVVRLLDMGMDPFNFSDALLGVLAQRLARRLCTHCRVQREASEREMETLLDEYCADLRELARTPEEVQRQRDVVMADWHERFADARGHFHLGKAVGCAECSQSGYRGRVGLHELMLGSGSLRRLIQARAPVSELLLAALAEGMRTLRQDGIEKVLCGETDMAQVRRVCIR